MRGAVRKKTGALLPLLLILALLCAACRGELRSPAISQPLPEAAAPPITGPGGPYLACLHYDEKSFQRALSMATPYQLNAPLLAATSPHFLPVMNFTANVLATLAEQQPDCETIFVLAPNHSGQGLPLIVADKGWSTPVGNLEVDSAAAAAILQAPGLAGKVDTDSYHLQSDHSAATLLPFIKHYLPDARVVTILLTKAATLEQLRELARIIYDIGTAKNIFVLGSVDFSHYLPIEEAAQRDEITRQLIYDADIEAIKRLDSGNMDAPEVLAALLYYTAYFSEARATQAEYTLLPESELKPDIGYSYQVYLFTE